MPYISGYCVVYSIGDALTSQVTLLVLLIYLTTWSFQSQQLWKPKARGHPTQTCAVCAECL